MAWGISIDGSGNIYIAGQSYIGSNDDYFTVKYDSLRNIVWADTLDNGNYDYARGIAVDGKGNVYVTGDSYIGGNYDYLTVKYDSLGNIIWADTLDNGSTDYAWDIAVDGKGNVYVTGGSYIGGNYDYLTVKYDSLGNIVWEDTIDNGDWDEAYGIALDASGDIYVTGHSSGDYFTVKYDSLGNILWADTLDNGGDDYAKGIAVDDSGNVYVTGYSYIDSNNDYFTIKYDSLGNMVWADTIDNGSNDAAFGIAVDGSGNVYVTGQSYIGSNYDYFTVKYRELGDIGVMSIASPDEGIITSGYHTISAVVKNLGTSTDSFDVYAEVFDTTNGWSEIFGDTVTISNLAAGDTTFAIFDSCNYQKGAVYLTRVFVNLPDGNPANDTLRIYSSTMHYKILYVEDAEGYGAPYHPDSTWYVPLSNIVSIDSIYWYTTSNSSEDGPSLAAMEHADLVIWNTYDYYGSPCFTVNDTININTYLGEGGKVWLIGQDIVYSMIGKKLKGRNKGVKAVFPWLNQFGIDSVREDYLYDTQMRIQGSGDVAGNPIDVVSDFDTTYDGYLHPDVIYYSTTAQPVLVDPDSNHVIGTITRDSTRAFWTADGRGADLSPRFYWNQLIEGMLRLFGILPSGIERGREKILPMELVIERNVGKGIEFTYRGERNAEIVVSDIMGRVIRRYKGVVSGNRISIKGKRLPSGIYFITIKGTDIKSKVVVIK